MAENNGVVLCKNKGEFSGLKATFLNANVNVKYTTANHFQGRIQEFLIGGGGGGSKGLLNFFLGGEGGRNKFLNIPGI